METAMSSRVSTIRFAGWIGLLVNLVLAAAKLVAGVLGHSQAVVADAVHSLSDIVTDVALIFGVRYWSAPADERHPHGHRRFETLITVFIGLMVAAAAVGIGWEAVSSFGKPSHPPAIIALIASVVSIGTKEALYRWSVKVGRATGSSALVANAWHHRTDALSSIPVAIAVAIAMVDHRLAVVDQIGALVVSVFVLHAAFRIIRPALDELVDAGAPSAHREELERLALDVDGVRAAHALRTRYIGSELAVDVHVEVDADLSVADGFEIARRVKQDLLQRGPDVADVVVQIEPHEGED
ncbi:MAG: cation diffusion facilitator family transporter [Candidatus Sulfomarinibacteraceae bacterium]